MIDKNIGWPVFYMLVGVPGSGKTTWANKNLPGINRISTDDLIVDWGQKNGVGYEEAWQKMYKSASKDSVNKIKQLIENRRSMVVDQTNLTKSSRSSKLDLIPKLYEKIAIVFDIDPDLALERAIKRVESGGNGFPGKDGFKEMVEKYEAPDASEFDQIIVVSMRQNLVEDEENEMVFEGTEEENMMVSMPRAKSEVLSMHRMRP